MDILATVLNSILSGVLVTILTKYLIGNRGGFFFKHPMTQRTALITRLNLMTDQIHTVRQHNLTFFFS